MKKVLFVLAVAGAFASCKKSETTPTVSCSTSSASIAGTYKISAVTYKASPSAAAEDWYTNWPDCQKDNTYEFKTDGSVTSSDAGVSCGLPPGPNDNSSWVLEGNNTILRMADIPLNIVSFNCSVLVVSESDISAAGDVKTTTYVKQ